MFASGMQIICAIGTSRFAVGAFGLSAATTYAIFLAWPPGRWRLTSSLAASPVAGSARSVRSGWQKSGVLNFIFALAIIAVAILMRVKSLRE